MSRATKRTEPARFRLHAVTWRQWLGFGAGLLATIALFLPWTVLSSDDPELAAALSELPAADVVRDAWSSGVLAWGPPLLLLLAGVAVLAFGQFRAVRVAGLPQLWLVATIVVLALLVLAWVGIGWQFGAEEHALLDEAGVAVAAGFGRYLGMVATVASFVAALLEVLASRRRR
ncbi:hypothetical protein [Amycolatopsis cihanbeyliensis]|uniref:Uncharacterized protein n=1 Tax=Amycolatopsis cihanbeyliensis TaxID=1128664 RepID=A0A542CUW0_AMYCI|nr:hypothetical protein [Amycolatopsis cihanbeyliensis]TQI94608.1 hypothetical protein FB471_6777 [Amycolatopsis cihanbeyliensis]